MVFTFVGNEKLVATDVGLNRRQWLGDRFVGKAAGQHAEVIMYRVLLRLRRCAARRREDQQQRE